MMKINREQEGGETLTLTAHSCGSILICNFDLLLFLTFFTFVVVLNIWCIENARYFGIVNITNLLQISTGATCVREGWVTQEVR